MNPNPTTPNRLKHINLAIQSSDAGISSVMMRERPFIGELNLDIDPDNLSLLIAVGEVMGVAQPLTVSRISCVGSLAILWLGQNRWLVLPPPGSQQPLAEALSETFGDTLSLDTRGDLLQARFDAAAIQLLQAQDDVAADKSFSRLQQEGVLILQPCDQSEYDLLVREHCAQRLWQWMSQHSGEQASMPQAANG